MEIDSKKGNKKSKQCSNAIHGAKGEYNGSLVGSGKKVV